MPNRKFVAATPVALVLLLAGCASHPPAHPVAAAKPPSSPSPSPLPSPHPAATPAAAPVCPLTGEPPVGGRVPARPALAIKVENLPQARPQTGLNRADIIYEEPVEGGITRFVVIYQCTEAPRVEPVRSGRLVDPDILRQFGHPLLGYAGAINPVIAKINASPVIGLSFNGIAAGAYHRDPTRYAPHNLYTSTAALWAFGHGPAPAPVFGYSPAPVGGTPATSVQIDFSSYSNVFWRYDPASRAYGRYYNGLTSPALSSSGRQISASNVVVQAVPVYPSIYVEDALGTHENIVQVVGSGPMMIFRDGVVIRGTWRRPTLNSVTKYYDTKGRVVDLAPGRTWVELVPDGRPVIPTR